MLADFTTFPGDSGGPLLVGIVLAMNTHEDRIKNEYEQRVVRHPLGIGTILHSQYVLEAPEAAAKGDRASPK